MEVKNQKVKQGRLSRMPLFMLLGLCAALLIAAFISMQDTMQDDEDKTADKSAALFANAREQAERLQAQGLAAASKKQDPPAEPVQPQPAVVMDSLQGAEAFERLQGRREEPSRDDPQQKLRQSREQAFRQALTAGSQVQVHFTQATTGGSSTAQGSALSQSQRAELEHGRQQLADLKAGGGQGNPLSAYDALATGDSHALPYRVQSVDTPYIIRQGAVVPAVLLTGINSDIPGQVIAQTTAPVYDSPLGNFELIPRGSRLLGQYVSQPAYGTERVMLAFNRIIMPDGKSLTLGAMPGASLDGYAGFDAEVDNHMMRLISGALLLGGITAAVSLSQDDVYDDDGHITVSSAMTQAVGASLGRVLAQVVERNINISPTLQVKPGYEFNLTLIKDLRFDGPYQGFDYAS